MGRGDGELRVGARGRLAVRPPALERGRVAEPVALEVVVGDFAHQLGSQGLEGKVLAGVPPALGAGNAPGGLLRVCPLERPRPGMVVLGVLAVRGELLHQLLAASHGEAGGDADMVE